MHLSVFLILTVIPSIAAYGKISSCAKIRGGAVTSTSSTTAAGASPKKKQKKKTKSPKAKHLSSPYPSVPSSKVQDTDESPSHISSLTPSFASSKLQNTNETPSPALNITSITSRNNQDPSNDRMPSLFTSPNESIYDRYAACLAATEGLRRIRDETLDEHKKQSRLLGGIMSWKSSILQPKSHKADSEEYKRACAQYVVRSSKVIRSLGLTVSQFNQIGRELGHDNALKERVFEQAYLYRMAAAINMDKVPIIEDPSSEHLLKSHKRQRVQMFARSIAEIEELRAEQIERLRKALHMDPLPQGINICDPTVLPLLNPKVRAVCEAFPLQAENILSKYGLNSNEFNQMLEQTRGNPVFRWRVKKFMGKKGFHTNDPVNTLDFGDTDASDYLDRENQ